MKQTTGAW